MRLQDAMLSKDFSKKVKSNNGHIYLKMLREEIVNELELDEHTQVDDLEYNFLANEYPINYDAESRANLSDVSN